MRFSESVHCEASALGYHRHGIPFATVVLEGSYIEVRDNIPTTHAAGAIVIHDANEEHADYFTRAGRCLNVMLDDVTIEHLHARLREATSAAECLRPDWLNAALERFAWVTDEPLRGAAQLVGVHPTHFSREFHRHLGMTPNDYRLRARVRHASELLLVTSARIATIAHDCGFNDQSHLTRAFGAALGLSPAAYRRTFER